MEFNFLRDPGSPASATLAFVLSLSGVNPVDAKGNPPILKVDDQSYGAYGGYPALLRYAAKAANFDPSSALDSLFVDDALALLSAKKPDYHAIDKMFAERSGPYLLGAKISIADIILLCNSTIDFEKYENLDNALKSAGGHPRVEPYMGSKKQ